MYHIVKSKSKAKPFSVVLVAENGEVLSSHPLKTKQACIKNIKAQLDAAQDCEFQDDTVKDPITQKYENGDVLDIVETDGEFKRSAVYIPGRNPKKKKSTRS